MNISNLYTQRMSTDINYNIYLECRLPKYRNKDKIVCIYDILDRAEKEIKAGRKIGFDMIPNTLTDSAYDLLLNLKITHPDQVQFIGIDEEIQAKFDEAEKRVTGVYKKIDDNPEKFQKLSQEQKEFMQEVEKNMKEKLVSELEGVLVEGEAGLYLESDSLKLIDLSFCFFQLDRKYKIKVYEVEE